MRSFTCLKAVDSKIVRGEGVVFSSGKLAVQWGDGSVQLYKMNLISPMKELK